MIRQLLLSSLTLTGSALAGDSLDERFRSEVRPLLATYCVECHGGDTTEAEIDLAAFATVTAIRERPRVWQRVRAMLETEQMPPREAKQPTDTERDRLRTWVRAFLLREAEARDGDPGPVVLRRLSNAEYAYTIRDLTGVSGLDPTGEFPVDGAAGEGFTNTGDALGMSPALVTKYLDAAKEVSAHAVLGPEGIRFSPHTSERDRTDELLARIQAFYRRFTDDGGGTDVDLHGIKFTTNQGGRLPLARYLSATLAERKTLASGAKGIDTVADERGLNAKYLRALWQALSADEPDDGSLLASLRKRWRETKSDDPSQLVAEIDRTRERLWKFHPIGHIGREGGPPRWMEAVGVRTLVTARRDIRWKLPAGASGKDVAFHLAAGDAGDGNDGDFVVWRNLRLEGGGRPPMPLRDLAGLQERIDEQRVAILGRTADYLAAARAVGPDADVAKVADAHEVDAGMLAVWLDYLAIGRSRAVEVEGHLTRKTNSRKGITGWAAETSDSLPTVVANSTDGNERIPGLARPHSVVVHPTPTHFAAVGWQSPIDGVVRIEASVTDAHNACGNGAEWVLQHRGRGGTGTLSEGEYDLGGAAKLTPSTVTMGKGDLISLIVGARDNSHVCDLTAITLVVSEINGKKRVWDLAADVSPELHAGNPHADRHGNRETWHFYHGEMAGVRRGGAPIVTVPAGSVLAAWRAEPDVGKRRQLAKQVQTLATGATPKDPSSPDARLRTQLRTLSIPVDLPTLLEDVTPGDRFGRHPLGHAVDPFDLVVRAPDVVEFRVPAELAKGRELVGTAELDAEHGREGTVRVQVLASRPVAPNLSSNEPILVRGDSRARERIEGSLNRFCNLFPPALCYARIVPVDQVVTLTLFHREDDHLRRLMLDERQAAELDRLWDELFYVAREPLKYQVAFEQIREFATQDRPDLVKAWAPHVKAVNDRADAFRNRLVETEPVHLRAALEFAARAWRRPLTDAERRRLRSLYTSLRDRGRGHDEAIRLVLARVLTSPAFLYRLESPAEGPDPAPVGNLELATRLSYFLTSSLPDAELRRVAEAGRPIDDDALRAQTRRLLDDPRIDRLALHFACQWLHVRDLESVEKNEQLFPAFSGLRDDVREETVRFFAAMFRENRSILDLLDADHTYVNGPLAKHYGIEGVDGPEWRRINGLRERGRGGVLGMASVLASQSGVSRTSPILRGNWVFETLLGERLPRPPATVPQLPDSVPGDLTARQLIERHSADAACAKCHARIDPYGFALERFDTTGRLRTVDVDTRTTLPDGTRIDGLSGLREYLLTKRRGDVVRQFCRKLLGYALGREVQLSDEPLLARIERDLAANEYRVRVAVEAIVTSRQFRDIRPRTAPEASDGDSR